MFLTAAELAELTGIKIGKDKKTREQLQSAELTRLRIPHYVNIAGRVVVARAVIEGRSFELPPVVAGRVSEPWEPDPKPATPPKAQRKPPPSVASDKDRKIEEYTHAGMLVEIWRDAGKGKRPSYFAVVVNPASKSQTGSVADAGSYTELRAVAEARADRKAHLWQQRLARVAADKKMN